MKRIKLIIFIFSLALSMGIILVNFISAEEKIDINSASWEDLQKITGVGPAIAQRIIDARPFSSVNDLIRVSGIGEITLQKITDQGLAWVLTQPQEKEEFQKSQIQETAPEIILSYPQNNPVDNEIEVLFSVSNLNNSVYDIKISIEKEGAISNIYNENQDKWQSSHYYIDRLFSGSSFEGTLKLKIKEEKITFKGEADIIIRIRENGKNSYAEYKDKINITEPQITEITGLASVSRPVSELPVSLRVSLTALVLSFFSGIMILILKKNCKKPKIC